MPSLRRLLLAALVLVSALRLAAADPAPAPERTRADVAALLTEFLSRVDDPAMHARFWADDLVYTSGKGEVRTKADILAGMAAPARDAGPKTTYAAEDVLVRPYGPMAALTFRLVARQPDGTTLRFRNSGTLLRREGRWEVVTWQATPIPEKS
jgi:hypothetical protein